MKRKLIAIILCVAMLIPCAMFNTFAEETANVDSGKVLYNQEFGESFKDKTFADADLKTYSTGYGAWKISNTDGYFTGWMANNRIMSLVSLPDVVPDHNTYTVELTYRYTTRIENNKDKSTVTDRNSVRGSAGMLIGFNLIESSNVSSNGQSHYTPTHIGTLYSADATDWIKFDTTDANYAAVRKAWAVTEDKTNSDDEYGEWITMKVSVDNDYFKSIEISCNGAKWTSETVIDAWKDTKLNTDILYIASYQSGFDIKSIRVVEGYDYTEYKGQFATKSYSDFCNTDVVSVGVQPGLTDAKARLVAEIDGSKFAAAGFKVALSYTDNTDSANPVAVTTNAKDMTAHYAYSSLAADGVIADITPEKEGNYLIAIVIDNIPDTVTNLKITFTPYAVTADSETYTGLQYVYDVATQTVTVQ